MSLKDANRVANSEDPDQTASKEAVKSGLALFAQPVCPKTLDHNAKFIKKEIVM